jgi:hypothetical protein
LIKVATAAQGLAVIALAAAKESWGLLAAAVLVTEAAALGPVVANAQSNIGTRLVSWPCSWKLGSWGKGLCLAARGIHDE